MKIFIPAPKRALCSQILTKEMLWFIKKNLFGFFFTPSASVFLLSSFCCLTPSVSWVSVCDLSSRYLRQICCESTWCPGGETVSEIVCSFCPLMLYLSRWMTRLPSTVEQPLSESVNVNVGFSQNLCKGRDLIFSLDCGTRSGGKPVAFDPCNKP